jgi:hypothetical protein
VHNRQELLPIRTLVTVLLLLPIAPASRAAQPAATREAGITGRVLTPDGTPVTQGNVTLMTFPTNRVSAAIDRTGHFRILPDAQGWRRLFISVPGFAPYFANVTVPSSRTMALPDIKLHEASYFHARFVTSDGEPLAAGGLRRRAIDRDGVTIPDPLEHVREQVEPDGSITVGPLPVGRILMAFDRPPFAQTRLRDIDVNGTKKIIEGGTIPIAPGAQLHVEVVDGAEKPVPKHEVWIEDAALPTLLSFQPVRTNEQGRAVFDRLASGRYRVWTKTAERCGGRVELTMSRLVAVGGSGATRAKLVVGGRATFKITTVLGALYSRSVTLSPDAPAISPWQSRIVDAMSQPRRLPNLFGSPSSCGGVTDSEGRVTLTPFPPGPAQLRVSLFNSSYIARVTVPENGAEMAIAIPDGLTPVHVTDQISHQPVAAQVIWVGGGGRVEAAATPNGDVLLEGVGKVGGALTISAREYQTLEGQFDETPETQQDVALMPSPSTRVLVHVVSSDGDAIPAAVVELLPRGVGDAAEFVAADAKGVATFLDVREGPLQFGAHAEGFASSTVRVSEDARVSIVISLKRAQ